MGEVKDNWYEDFFQGLNCELWEKAVSPESTKLEADFCLAELNVQPGQSLLDISCGFGRHSIEFALRGYEVTGIDISQTFMAALKERIKADNLSIEAIEADFLKIELDRKFSGAVCLGNSFGYFSFDKMKLFVANVASCLEIGAKVIINSGIIAESILPNFPKYKSYTVQDITMEISNTYSVKDSYMMSHILYTKHGEKEEHSFKQYVFTVGEVKRLLRSCGLETVATYNSPSKIEYSLGDPQIYFVAERKQSINL